MTEENLDTLLKTNDDKKNPQKPPETSRLFSNTKKIVKDICKDLTTESLYYFPQETIDRIEIYINNQDKLDRILYSEISNYVFNLDVEKRGIFATNLEKLFLSSIDVNLNVTEDAKKIIIKFYDHFQLVLKQIDNIEKISKTGFEKTLEEAKNDLHKEMKGMEKEYIAILGIFAAIVIAFVGEMTFSTSVLENMYQIECVENIIAIITMVGVVFVNILLALFNFVSYLVKGYNIISYQKIFQVDACIAFFIILLLLIAA